MRSVIIATRSSSPFTAPTSQYHTAFQGTGEDMGEECRYSYRSHITCIRTISYTNSSGATAAAAAVANSTLVKTM